MRYGPEHKERTRRTLIDAAGRAFRAHGLDGIGVDGVAKAAGLTSGAFYRHFASKQAAVTAVVTAGVRKFSDGVAAAHGKLGDGWFARFAGAYLSERHRRDIAGGCVLPSLSAEVARADAETRAAYETELVAAMRAVAAAPPFAGRADAQAKAWTVLAMLAGGVMLSRAVADEATGQEIADAVLANLPELDG